MDCRNTRPHRPEPCTTLTCASCLDVGDSSARCSAASITKPEETAVDVGGWLKSLGLEQYEAAFRENGVNADILRHLTADDLKELGIAAVGHRRQLLIAIDALGSKAGLAELPAQVLPGPPTDPTGQPDASDTTAERRPLSV